MPMRTMASESAPWIGSPRKRMLPALGTSRPETVRSTVVLPAPLAPISATSSPSRTSSETESSQRLRDLEQALIAVGKLLGAKRRLGGEPHRLERCARARLGVRVAARQRAGEHALDERERAEHLGFLEGAHHAELGDAERRLPFD